MNNERFDAIYLPQRPVTMRCDAIGIAATLLHPDGELPISVVLEAQFWTGLPSLIGALIDTAQRQRAVVDRRRRSRFKTAGVKLVGARRVTRSSAEARFIVVETPQLGEPSTPMTTCTSMPLAR